MNKQFKGDDRAETFANGLNRHTRRQMLAGGIGLAAAPAAFLDLPVAILDGPLLSGQLTDAVPVKLSPGQYRFSGTRTSWTWSEELADLIMTRYGDTAHG